MVLHAQIGRILLRKRALNADVIIVQIGYFPYDPYLVAR